MVLLGKLHHHIKTLVLVHNIIIMKKIFILFFTISSCTAELAIPNLLDENLPVQSSSITYQGYYLQSLQINEDGTYRITLFQPDGTIQVIISVPKEMISIQNDKPINAVYKELNNGSLTGRYVIYLQTGFLITNYFI